MCGLGEEGNIQIVLCIYIYILFVLKVGTWHKLQKHYKQVGAQAH
jgi:hypothetical protein